MASVESVPSISGASKYSSTVAFEHPLECTLVCVCSQFQCSPMASTNHIIFPTYAQRNVQMQLKLTVASSGMVGRTSWYFGVISRDSITFPISTEPYFTEKLVLEKLGLQGLIEQATEQRCDQSCDIDWSPRDQSCDTDLSQHDLESSLPSSGEQNSVMENR